MLTECFKVPAASGSAVSTTEDEDFYYEELANEYKKLPGLHLSTDFSWIAIVRIFFFYQGATSKVEAFNAYKNSMTYIGALLNHFGTAGISSMFEHFFHRAHPWKCF